MAMINSGKGVDIGPLIQSQSTDRSSEAPKTREDVMARGSGDGVSVLDQMKTGKLEVRVGNAEESPSGQRSGFMTKLKAGWESFKSAVGNFFTKFFTAEGREKREIGKTVLETLAKPEPLGKDYRGELLAKASQSGDLNVAARVLQKLGEALNSDSRANLEVPIGKQRSEDALKLVAVNNLRMHDRTQMDGSVMDFLKTNRDTLESKLSGDADALKLLKFLTSFTKETYETVVMETFSQEISFLDEAATDMETFNKMLGQAFRGEKLFTMASRDRYHATGDREGLTEAIRTTISDIEGPRTYEIEQYLYNNENSFKLSKLDRGMSEIVVDINNALLELASKESGPGSAMSAVGEDGIKWVRALAQQVMDHPHAPLEAKEALILKLVSDQILLRGFANIVAMLNVGGKAISVPASAVLLRALNDKNLPEETPQVIKNAYPQIRQAAQDCIRGLVEKVMQGVTQPGTGQTGQVGDLKTEVEQLQMENDQSWNELETEILAFGDEVKNRNNDDV